MHRLVPGILAMLALTLSGSLHAESVQQNPVVQNGQALSAELREKILAWVADLGSEVFEKREAATQSLAEAGSRAIPFIAEKVNDGDVEIALRARAVLLRIKGIPGDTVEGLTLTATQVGKCRKGEVVTLWLTVANTSEHEINFMQYFWALKLEPAVKPRSQARVVSVSTGATLEPHDFLSLKPGQSMGYLMDADTDDGEPGSITRARLELSMPEQARNLLAGAVFSGSHELISGPINLQFEEKPIDRAGKEKLYLPEDGARWSAFLERLKTPRVEDEDAIIDFIGRYGPRTKNEGRMQAGLREFIKVLPKERRPAFLLRICMAMAHDWRSVNTMAREYTNSQDRAERAAAARAFLELYRRGDRRDDVLNWLAGELFRTPDPNLKNVDLARQMAQEAVKAKPGNLEYKYTLADIEGRNDELEKLAAQAQTPSEKNNLAWELSTNKPSGSAHSKLAQQVAQEAVQGTPVTDGSYGYRVDTLAVATAANFDYKTALELEREAYGKIAADDDERRNYAERIALYTALLVAPASERPEKTLDPVKLKSDAARNALLAALKTERESMILKAIQELLRKNWPRHADVEAAPKVPAQ